MNTHLNTKRILIFLAFAVGIPWTATLAFYLTVGMDDPVRAGQLANYFFLTSPALANLATRNVRSPREQLRFLLRRELIQTGIMPPELGSGSVADFSHTTEEQ